MATKKPSTTKKAPVKKPVAKKVVKLDPKKMYDFVVSKDSKHMSKGTYKVDGTMAMLLTEKGIGSVKA